MAIYKQVGYGSQGSEVTELQKLLNSKGNYNLATDGIFGDKTKAAVMDYQKQNNLDVDGIVGTNTWGALTQSNAAAAGSPAESTQAESKLPTFSYEAYKPSDTVAQAEALLQQQLMNKPGAYQSSWQGQLNEIIQNIQNRDKFSYNLNEDALYQQLKDQYVLLGQQASMDTMGQAATLTGGYGNSYAQSVGQQAYQGYLQQLNDKVPELYGMALDQYNREGQAMYDQAALMAQMEDQDYGRYRDQMSDYYAELDRLTSDSRYQAEKDYGRYMDGYNMAYGQFIDDRNFAYQQERDQKADQQWQAQFDEAKRQYDQEYELALQKYADSKKASSDTPNNPQNPTKDTNYDAEAAKKQQELADAGYDIIVNGIWGPESEAVWAEYMAARGTPTNNETANDTENVSSTIKTKASGFTSNTDLANYLDGLAASGTITEAQADSLYAEYKQPERAALKDRSWTREDDGGVNWFWGIDNNATVKDQYGNTYRMDKLVDALVADGMTKADAKAYVKNLQAKLGA